MRNWFLAVRRESRGSTEHELYKRIWIATQCLLLSQSTSVQQIGNSSKRMAVWIGSAVLSRWLRMILAPFSLILFNRQLMRWTCQQYQLCMELLQRMHFLLITIAYLYQWTFQRSSGIKRVKIPPSRDVYCMSVSFLKLIIGYILFCHLHILYQMLHYRSGVPITISKPA